MAFKIGTAQTDRELLTILDEFLTSSPELVARGENWQRIRETNITATSTEAERLGFVWVAPGSAGADQIFVACQTNNSIPNDIYNLYFMGGTYYDINAIPGGDIWSCFSIPSARCGICADSREFRYWIVANGRRFIVITVVNGVYSSSYCGFMLPNATPDEYPYPCVVSGSLKDSLIRYSTTSNDITSIVDPRVANQLQLFHPEHTWKNHYGRPSDSNRVYPNCLSSYNSDQFSVLKLMHNTPGDTFPLLPVMLMTTGAPVNFWGALDGVYWVPGVSRMPEDEFLTVDNKHFIVFQNAYRTETTDYFAIEMI